MRKSIIVAVSENGVIGAAGKIPWRLPEDLKRFKQLTMGHCLIMGRKTHESIGRALPGRTNIVLTRELFKDFGPSADVWRHHDLDGAVALADKLGDKEAFICGGGEVYREALPLCDRVYLTVVEREYDGDVWFHFDTRDWKRIETKSVEGELPHRFEVWDRA
jgi:dihydrofolate reductase